MTAVVAAASPAVGLAGRTVVRPLALRRVAEATIAELVGVTPREVSVELTDARGELAIAVTTPLDPRAARVHGTLLERAAAITAELAGRLGRLADRTVGRVSVRLTRLVADDDTRRVE